MYEMKRQITEAHRRHLSESHMGIKRTPEALAKARKTMKLKWKNPEYRNKVVQARMGHFTSEETKRKISKAHVSISSEQERRIINLYQDGMTGAELEAELNIGEHVIFSCLKRNNIETRRVGIRNGCIPWNKDLKLSEEQKAKLNMEGLNIEHPWNRGKTGIYSEDRLKQMSELMKSRVGEKANNWKGGISYGHKTGYYSSRYKEWRIKVFERDDYTCQDCGICSGNGKVTYLTAHHIKSFAKYPELRFEVSNGVTLCETCHCKVDKYRARFMNKEN